MTSFPEKRECSRRIDANPNRRVACRVQRKGNDSPGYLQQPSPSSPRRTRGRDQPSEHPKRTGLADQGRHGGEIPTAVDVQEIGITVGAKVVRKSLLQRFGDCLLFTVTEKDEV